MDERPALTWPRKAGTQSPVVWWIVFVGYSYALATSYAAYCWSLGGTPVIDLIWSGFKVTCLH
jgi:hypothetical protein